MFCIDALSVYYRAQNRRFTLLWLETSFSVYVHDTQYYNHKSISNATHQYNIEFIFSQIVISIRNSQYYSIFHSLYMIYTLININTAENKIYYVNYLSVMRPLRG